MSDHILFHPYEPLLVFGNAKTGNLCTWDTDRMTQAAFWPSGTAHGAQLSSMQLVNEHDVALLATASSDGVVRLWRDFATPEPRLLTGWRAVAKMRTSSQPSGLKISWSQRLGTLLAAGDVSYVQLWDAYTQQRRQQKVTTGVESGVTSLCVEPTGSELFVAGFGNGNVCLYDPRLPADRATVQKYVQHTTSVVNVHLQQQRGHLLISGSKGGVILWYDARFPGQAVRNLTAFKLRSDDYMRAMVVHNNAPILAASAPNQYIKIFNLAGEQICSHKHYANFLGEAMGPNRCLGFHPFRPLLASGNDDSIVSIFAPGR